MRFSCVVPAFNEGSRILAVVTTVLECDDIFEVVVVDDGSTDDTWEVVSSISHPRLRTIHLEKNVGKTKAIFHGISLTSSEYVMMVDSDLLYLTPEHIKDLLLPIQNHTADVTLSLRENSLGIYKFFKNDFVTGERVVPRSILEDTNYYTSGPAFGLEVKMNEKIINQKFRVKSVYFPGVIAPRKSYKCGYFEGTYQDYIMVRDIVSLMGLYRLIRQIWYFYQEQSK